MTKNQKYQEPVMRQFLKVRMKNINLIVLLLIAAILITSCSKAKTQESQPTRPSEANIKTTEPNDKEQASSELPLINEWFDISKQLDITLNKIDNNIKSVQLGKVTSKDMMKTMISLKKELLNIHQNTTMLSALNNPTLYDAKKIYYDETNNIWHSADIVLDWLTGLSTGDINKTDNTILEEYNDKIKNSMNKIKNIESSVNIIESETKKRAEVN